jgi:hypothetical protein
LADFFFDFLPQVRLLQLIVLFLRLFGEPARRFLLLHDQFLQLGVQPEHEARIGLVEPQLCVDHPAGQQNLGHVHA